MWFLVVGMKKGLSIARKVASRDVVCCSRDEEGLIDCENGGPERGGLL